MPKDVAVILAAAGKSSRFGNSGIKKVFTLLQGRAVWLHSVDLFSDHPRIGQILVIIDPEDREMFQEKFAAGSAMMGLEVVMGGRERWESIQNGLERVRSEMAWVAVHDAARPCLTRESLDRVLEGAEETGAAILALPIDGTIKRSLDGKNASETVSRENLWQAQTPQVFRKDLLLRAYAQRGSLNPTDDAQLVESMKVPVRLVPGSPFNLKITRREDLRSAEAALKSTTNRKGISFFS